MNVKKDISFNTRVTAAQYNQSSSRWIVSTEDGRTTRAKFFLVTTGFAAKRHFPDWPGLDSYEGEIHHSSFWPNEGVEVAGKRVAVIGTGSTGIQIAQETAKTAASVTVFQRTPNLALPMRQGKLSREEQDKNKKHYEDVYKHRMTTFAGFQYDFVQRNTFDDSPEEREKLFEGLWDRGGFEFWLATYKDMLFDEKVSSLLDSGRWGIITNNMKANREAYDFWAKKTRARISDPKKRDILAPVEPLHFFGTKRPSLEQNFYELMDQPQNEVVDLKATPIEKADKTGIITSDGKHREFDVIALATGFDSVTGGMMTMGLQDIEGVPLSKKWKPGTYSYLGMTISGYPNMFYLYGAHGPTAFSNGPSCVECQGDWIVDVMVKMRDEGITYINPTKESEIEWRKKIQELSDKTLFPRTDSWYMGANIPGKTREQLNFAGGLPLYEKEARTSLNNGFEGFVTA